jgi:hypothetical protein
MKKFIITEEEKSSILNMYKTGVISEQQAPSTGSTTEQGAIKPFVKQYTVGYGINISLTAEFGRQNQDIIISGFTINGKTKNYTIQYTENSKVENVMGANDPYLKADKDYANQTVYSAVKSFVAEVGGKAKDPNGLLQKLIEISKRFPHTYIKYEPQVTADTNWFKKSNPNDKLIIKVTPALTINQIDNSQKKCEEDFWKSSIVSIEYVETDLGINLNYNKRIRGEGLSGGETLTGSFFNDPKATNSQFTKHFKNTENFYAMVKKLIGCQ